MKQIFWGTFVFLLLMSLVAVVIEPSPAPPGKTPLVWTCDDSPARREQIKLFNEMYPDYHLILDPANVDGQKVIVQSVAGVGPDLFSAYTYFQLVGFVKSGIAWDVTDQLAEMGIDYKETVWKPALSTFVYEGRAYGFANNVASHAMWYNKAIFDKSGLTPPQTPLTWEEFLPLAQQLTHYDEQGKVVQFGLLFDMSAWPLFVMQWGGRLFNEAGTVCTIDSPECVEAIQFMQDLIYRHKVSPSPLQESAMATQGGWGSGTITFFGAGKGAMAIGGRWWLCLLRDYEGLSLGAFECPHGPLRVFPGYSRATLINQYSPNREKALKFLEFLASKQYNNLINQQADAIGPIREFSYTPDFLHNPDYPEEDFHEVWRSSLEYAYPEETSPFVNGNVAQREIEKQLDLVRNNIKTAQKAMTDAAERINREIARSLERDPKLKKQYQRLTGGN